MYLLEVTKQQSTLEYYLSALYDWLHVFTVNFQSSLIKFHNVDTVTDNLYQKQYGSQQLHLYLIIYIVADVNCTCATYQSIVHLIDFP